MVALDTHGRIRLVNDEAQRLLGLGAEAAGRPLDEVLPPGRTTDVLAGRAEGKDLLTVGGELVANRMPIEGGGAVATLEGGRIDLVLLDHYLPDETGPVLVRRMRQPGHHADVIMVTAARDVVTVQAAMRFGVLQCPVKPFGFAGLRAELDGYAALRRTLDGVVGGGGGEAGQEQVDRIFGALRTAAAAPAALPKGHSAPTADLIRRVPGRRRTRCPPTRWPNARA